MACSHKKNAEEINANGIRAKMRDIIFEEFKRLIIKQVDPWIFYNSKGVRVEKFDGKYISHSGCKFGQTSRLVFWNGYIEPYIEDVVKKKIEETIELAKGKNVPISAVLGSTKANLSGGIDTVYRNMQKVDRQLRGNGDPKSVPKRDISHKIKEMDDFLDRQVKIHENLSFQIPKILELIDEGESHTLEFKETLEWDVRQGKHNSNLNKESLKTIAAFLNTDGGTLLIGISDAGEVKGIARDLKSVNGKNCDGFEQKLRSLINSRFDPSPFGNIEIIFNQLQQGTICQIKVERSLEPIFYDKIFYIRDGNGSRKLEGRKLADRILQRATIQTNQVREHKRQIEKQRSKITAALEHLHKHGCYELIITNNSFQEAHDIKVILSGNPISELGSVEPKIPCFPIIGPGSSVSYHWRCNEPVRPPFELEITWSDDSGEAGLYRTTLSHPTTPKTS